MTFFIKVENKEPVGFAITENNLKQLFPNHSFPSIYTPDNIEPFGFAIFEWSQPPLTEFPMKAIEITPIFVGGVYRQSWAVVEMSNDENF